MVKSKRGTGLLALTLALSVGLCGCARPAEAPAAKHKVAVVVKTSESEFFESAFAGAKAAAAEYNLNLTLRAPVTEEDYETQNRMVRQEVAAGTEALILSAIDYEKNAPAVEEAARAGVKIVAMDSGVNTDMVSTYIGTDNYAAGRMAAQAALQSDFDELRVGLINFDVNTANGQEREQGVRDALAESERAEIVAALNAFSQADDAQECTEELMREHPEINVLIAFNEPTSVGAARAVEKLGRKEGTWLVGFDSNVETVDGLQTGVVDSLIVQNPYAMGYLGVEIAGKLITGTGDPVEKIIDTSTVLIDRNNMFTAEGQKALFPFRSR